MTIKRAEDIKADWCRVQNDTEEAVMMMLRKHYDDTAKVLAKVVAGLCGITTDDLFSACDTLAVSQARWLFWYAYRRATNETYEQIAERTAEFGRRFTPHGIRKGVDKMMRMADKETTWRNRWLAVRHVIKNRDDASLEASETGDFPKCKLTLNVPKGMKDKIKIEIQEFPK